MTIVGRDSGELVDAGHEDLLRRLVAGWLLGYPSPHTRRAYARDLDGFTRWCAQLVVEVLAANPGVHARRPRLDPNPPAPWPTARRPAPCSPG